MGAIGQKKASAMNEEILSRCAAPMTVLVVDDEQSTRELCATVSAECGMKVQAVGSAEEALMAAWLKAMITPLRLLRVTLLVVVPVIAVLDLDGG